MKKFAISLLLLAALNTQATAQMASQLTPPPCAFVDCVANSLSAYRVGSPGSTDYERIRVYWNGSASTLVSEAGGTGTARNLILTANAGNTITVRPSGSTLGSVQFSGTGGATASTIGFNFSGVNLTASSGSQTVLIIGGTITQTGTAGYTSLLINTTESSTGSGAKLLADFQVTGVSMASISNAGALSALSLNATGNIHSVSALTTWANNQTCTAGQMTWDANFIYVCTATNTVKRATLNAF